MNISIGLSAFFFGLDAANFIGIQNSRFLCNLTENEWFRKSGEIIKSCALCEIRIARSFWFFLYFP